MRFIINFIISAVLIFIFEKVGWLTIANAPAILSDLVLNQLFVAGVIGLFFSIVITIASLVLGIFILASCGIGCFLLPFYYIFIGIIGFWGISVIFPGLVTITTDNLHIFIMGFLLIIFKVSSSSKESHE